MLGYTVTIPPLSIYAWVAIACSFVLFMLCFSWIKTLPRTLTRLIKQLFVYCCRGAKAIWHRPKPLSIAVVATALFWSIMFCCSGGSNPLFYYEDGGPMCVVVAGGVWATVLAVIVGVVMTMEYNDSRR